MFSLLIRGVHTAFHQWVRKNLRSDLLPIDLTKYASMDERVIGIGGIFFKSADPRKTRDWYQEHLGLNMDQYGSTFEFRNAKDPSEPNFLQWSAFPEDTDYMSPSANEFMVNYRVKDLEKLSKALAAEGIELLDGIEEYSYGKFAHILDPDGRKIELWEPNNVEYMTMTEGNTTK